MKDDHSQENSAPSETNINNTFIAQADPIPPSPPHLEVVPNRPILRAVPQPNSPTTPIPNIQPVGPVINRIVPSSISRFFIPLAIAYELYRWGEKMDEDNRLPDTVQNPMSLPAGPPTVPYVPSNPAVGPVGNPNAIHNTINRLVEDGQNDPRGNPVGSPGSQPGNRPNAPVEIDLNREINRIQEDIDRTHQEETTARQREVNRQLSEEARRNRRAQEDFQRQPPTTPSNPGNRIPSYTINNPGDNGDWMGDPEPVNQPTPQRKPNSLPNVPAPTPTGLNLGGSPPRISGGRSTWNPRASQQEEPAAETVTSPSSDENPEQPEQSDNHSERSRDRGDQRRRDRSASDQSGGDRGTSEQQQIEKLEAQKLRVEKQVAKLKSSQRNIANLPNGLEEKLNSVGYRINRGDNTRITYHGDLPSGSQLHLEKDSNGVWTIEQGRSKSKRTSSHSRAKSNLLRNTGVEEIPEGYQISHDTPDAVWQNSKLLQEYDKKSGRQNLDNKENLTLLPESRADAKRGQGNPDVQTLKEQDLLLNNIHHRGSHGKWSKRIAKLYDVEQNKLENRYGSLENAPLEEIEKSVKKVQEQIKKEQRAVDRKIERGDTRNLPSWVQPDPDGPGWRLSDLPSENRKQSDILADHPDLAVALGQAVRRLTQKIVDAHTYSLDPNDFSESIFENPTRKDLAQLLGNSVANAFGDQNVNAIHNNYYKMARLDPKNILITNFPGGEKLAVVNTENNTIAMHSPLSSGQMDFLKDELAKATAAITANAEQNNPARGRSNQMEIG